MRIFIAYEDRAGTRRRLTCGCRMIHKVNIYAVPYWHRTRKCGKPEGFHLGIVCRFWRFN